MLDMINPQFRQESNVFVMLDIAMLDPEDMTLFEKTSDHNGNISKPLIQVMFENDQNDQNGTNLCVCVCLFVCFLLTRLFCIKGLCRPVIVSAMVRLNVWSPTSCHCDMHGKKVKKAWVRLLIKGMLGQYRNLKQPVFIFSAGKPSQHLARCVKRGRAGEGQASMSGDRAASIRWFLQAAWRNQIGESGPNGNWVQPAKGVDHFVPTS